MSGSDWINPLILYAPAFILNLLHLIDSLNTMSSRELELKKVQHILIAGVLQSVIYFSEYLIAQNNYFGIRSLGMAITSLLFLVNLLYFFTYADLLYSKYIERLTRRGFTRWIFFSPILVLAVLEFINIFTPVFFSIDPVTFGYTENPIVAMVSLIPLMYIGFSMVSDIVEWHRNPHYFNLPVSMFFSFAALGIIGESLLPEVPIIPISAAISVTILYLRAVKRLAYIDPLSGLYTRAVVPLFLNSANGRLSHNEMLACIMVDINHFKTINDTHGHAAGDRAIALVGGILKNTTGRDAICFRYGGDEFVVMLRVTQKQQITHMMEQINKAVADFSRQNHEGFEISLAQGYAVYNAENYSFVSFMDKIDTEMYRNKHTSN